MSEYDDLFKSYGARYGLPDDALRVIAQLESNMNPQAKNPVSSAGGLFQFVDATAPAYGLTGNKRFDPTEATRAAAELTRDNSSYLQRTLGRQPTVGELYLAHQQGMGGASALLGSPGQTAVGVLSRVYGDAERARKAVVQNGGNVNMTAGEFANLWINKADKVLGEPPAAPQYRNVAFPVARPSQPIRLPIMSYAGMETPRQTRLPPIPPSSALGAIQTAAPGAVRPGSPGWWNNPLGTARTAVAGLGIGGLIAAPNMQRNVGNALMSTPSGRGIVLRQALGGGTPAPVRVAQVQPQRTYNPSNHSSAQMRAVASGRSTYTGSDGGQQPTHAMNGNLRYTY